MKFRFIVLSWLLSGFGTVLMAEASEPIVGQLLEARNQCANILLELGLIEERVSGARTDRVERCVTDRIGFKQHVFSLVALREAQNPGAQILFIDAVEEIRERMDRIPHPFQ